jgi:hypothetical protein
MLPAHPRRTPLCPGPHQHRLPTPNKPARSSPCEGPPDRHPQHRPRCTRPADHQ